MRDKPKITTTVTLARDNWNKSKAVSAYYVGIPDKKVE